jgi:hypothetical protein
MSLRVAFVAAAVTACLFVSNESAKGQEKLLFFSGLKGKIVFISGDVIQWTDATGADMKVQIDKKTKTQLLGEVEPSFLNEGMFVRFPAEVTKRGKVVDAIEELTIFSPLDGFSAGIFEDGPVDPKAASAKYLISGQLTAIKGGLMTVNAGQNSFKFKLADDAQLKIDVSDYTLARPDDEINITGSGVDKTQIVAKGVEIQLATPLAGEVKKSRKATAKKPARDAD